ncbi:MAG: thioredoxin [Bacteroidetes bacterium]|nr:thioredoxin [Bacteroidota bacterium]
MFQKFSLLSCTVFLFVSCFAQIKNGVEFLKPNDFLAGMDTTVNALVLDVRTPEEFAKNRLNHAVNFNWLGSDFVNKISQIDKSTPVFVYCLSGGRSKAAAEKMAEVGFTKIYALDGGLLKWQAANLPEIKSQLSTEGMSKMDFEKKLISGKTILVDFYAEWCAPCKEMEPFLKELALENPGNLILLRINIDENPALADALNIHAIPYLQIYKEQKVSWEKQGFTDKKSIQLHL